MFCAILALGFGVLDETDLDCSGVGLNCSFMAFYFFAGCVCEFRPPLIVSCRFYLKKRCHTPIFDLRPLFFLAFLGKILAEVFLKHLIFFIIQGQISNHKNRF